MTDSFCCFRYSYISSTHLACSGFRSLNFRETLTSPGDFPFVSWRITLSAYHLLNWFEINFFAFWLMVKSSGWNLFVKLCGTMTNWQLFSKHKYLIPSLSWPLKVSIMISKNGSCGYPSSIFFARKYGNVTFSNKSTRFSKFDQRSFVYVTLNCFENLCLGKHLLVVPWYIN